MARHLRPFTGGQFSLELDGTAVGFLTGVDGGHFKSDEVKSSVGYDNYLVTKYAGKPKYEDITIGIGMPNSSRLFSWVKSSVENNPERHTGALVGFDNFQNKQERSRRVFDQALISEITFPALDAANNQPANITLKISPELLRYERGGSKFNAQQARDEAVKQKRWSCANFGLRLDGFWGQGAQRNAKVEAFTIKQGIMANPIGRMLVTHKYAGRVEMPSLQISFPQSDLKQWTDWYDEVCSPR